MELLNAEQARKMMAEVTHAIAWEPFNTAIRKAASTGHSSTAVSVIGNGYSEAILEYIVQHLRRNGYNASRNCGSMRREDSWDKIIISW